MQSRVFFCGSCFTENMGRRMENLGFKTFINPYGILYDPLSIARSLNRIENGTVYLEKDLVLHHATYHSLDHHGSFHGENAAALLEKIQAANNAAKIFIQEADIAVLTYGTSFYYSHTESAQSVGNCHKLPNSAFTKHLLPSQELHAAISQAVNSLRAMNPNIRILFTVSPVKHLRDGIEANAVSKAKLLSVIQEFLSADSTGLMDYFPAFEIMQEELRDHRFYESDLAHPTAWSLEYIWQRFVESRFNDRAKICVENLNQYAKMKAHIPMTSNADELEKWDKQKMDFLEKIKRDFPEINL